MPAPSTVAAQTAIATTAPTATPTSVATPIPAPTPVPADLPPIGLPDSIMAAHNPGSLSYLLDPRNSVSKPDPQRERALPRRIVLSSIHVDSVVREVGWRALNQSGQLYSEWDIAEYAVGFHQNSALPGAVGNTVMSGHNNIKGEVFRNLNDVQIGDEVSIYTADKLYRYRVTQKLLLKESGATPEQRIQNGLWLAPTDDARLTLVSCWPYTTYTHRVVIIATPIG